MDKIYFAPNGVALGHAGRCMPIARKAEKEGYKVIFSTYGDAVEFVKRAGYPVLITPQIKFEETSEGAVAMLETSIKWPKHIMTFLKQLQKEIVYLKKVNPKIIISDSRLSPLFAGRLLGIPRILLLHQIRILIPHRKALTPLQRKLKHFGEDIIMYDTHLFWRSSDIILAPDFPPPFTIAKENLYVPKKMLRNVEFIGQIISKRPEQLPPKEELKKALNLDDRPVIYAGIAGTIMEKKELNKILMNIFKRFPDKYQIIITRGIPDEPDKIIYEKGNLRVYNWVSNRYNILKASDVVVSRAGHNTIAECLYYGKPTVLIPTPAHTEHQGNAKSAAQMGISKVIQQKDLTYDTLLHAITQILEDNKVQKRVTYIQSKISKLNAVETVIKKVKYFIEKNS